MTAIADNKISKRTRILNSAFKLFTDKSVNSTAIDDIVKSAGIAKGTFYLYFKDKYDLLDQLIIHKGSGIIKEAYFSAFSNINNSFEDKMLCFINNIIDSLAQNREIAILVQKNLSRFFRSLIHSDDAELKEAIENITFNLEKNGFNRSDAEKTLYLLTDLTGSVCCDAIVYEKPYSIEDIRPLFILTVKNILRQGAVS